MSTVWEHSLTILLGHDHTTEPGMALRHWVHFQGGHSLLDLLSWDPEELKAVPTQQVYHQDDHRQYIHHRTNQVKHFYWLITYMKYIFESFNSGPDLPHDPFHPFSPDEWAQHRPTLMRTYLIQHLPDPHEPNPVPSGPISQPRTTSYSSAAIEITGFNRALREKLLLIPHQKMRDTLIGSLYVTENAQKRLLG